MIPEKDLEGFLSDTGIKSPKEEVEKILQSDFVSGKLLSISIIFCVSFILVLVRVLIKKVSKVFAQVNAIPLLSKYL